MFDINIQELQTQSENTILKKTINLDKDLDCFITLSSKNKVLAENIFNHAIENILDKISKEDSYNDFGIALESINAYLKNWRENSETDDRVDMVISVLNENDFMFSNIGKTGVYLLNTNNELIELTEKGENKKEFLFISNGSLSNGDIVVTSTLNLLKYLTKSDLVDGALVTDDLHIFGKNIFNILKEEVSSKNAIVSSIRYENELYEENDFLAPVKNAFFTVADLPLFKSVGSQVLKVKDKIDTQSNTTRNLIFMGLIALCIAVLYYVVNSVVFNVSDTEVKQEAKTSVAEIRKLIGTAEQNLANPQVFQSNIAKAEEQIVALESLEQYQTEADELLSSINLLKKQFNNVEIYEPSVENTLLSRSLEAAVGIIEENNKTYVITKTGVVGPIINGQDPVENSFEELKNDEVFVEGVLIGNTVYLMTNTDKIVSYGSNGRFSYTNVTGQEKWEDMKSIDTYRTNLYTLGEDNQIYNHSNLTTAFSAGRTYLEPEDRNTIGKVLDFSIDGGFYLVNEKLEMYKFFSSPYRLIKLEVYNLPKNFEYDASSTFKIKSRNNLNYVYLLMNNKIWVFKTNSRDFQSTTSLKFVGQIEGAKNKIIDFYVDSDTSVLAVDQTGIYKINFEISDDKLILR